MKASRDGVDDCVKRVGLSNATLLAAIPLQRTRVRARASGFRVLLCRCVRGGYLPTPIVMPTSSFCTTFDNEIDMAILEGFAGTTVHTNNLPSESFHPRWSPRDWSSRHTPVFGWLHCPSFHVACILTSFLFAQLQDNPCVFSARCGAVFCWTQLKYQ